MDFLYTPNTVAGFFYAVLLFSAFFKMIDAVLEKDISDLTMFEIHQTTAGWIAIVIGVVMSPMWKEFYDAFSVAMNGEDFAGVSNTLQKIDWLDDPVVKHPYIWLAMVYYGTGIPHAITGALLVLVSYGALVLLSIIRMPILVLMPMGYILGFWALPLFIASFATYLFYLSAIVIGFVMLLVAAMFFALITGTLRLR